MIRILCVIGQLGNGGSEKQLYLFLRYLDKKRNSASVFVTSTQSGVWKERIEKLDIKIFSVPNDDLFSKIRYYRKILTEEQPDIVFSWSYYTNALSIFSSGRYFIGSLRQQFSEALELYGRLRCSLCKRVDHMVVNSTFIAEELKKNVKIHSNAISVVFNIFDACRNSLLSKEKAREMLYRKFGTPTEKKLVIGIGGSGEAKNFPFFVDTLISASEKNKNIHGVIIGAGGRNVKSMIKYREQESLFTLTGELDEAWQFLPAADLFFLSSKQEGMPNVLIEAVAAGCPTLATDVGGARDIYKFVPENLIDSILLDNFNTAEAAKKMNALLSDSDLRNQAVRYTKKIIRELTPEKIMNNYYSVLEQFGIQ